MLERHIDRYVNNLIQFPVRLKWTNLFDISYTNLCNSFIKPNSQDKRPHLFCRNPYCRTTYICVKLIGPVIMVIGGRQKSTIWHRKGWTSCCWFIEGNICFVCCVFVSVCPSTGHTCGLNNHSHVELFSRQPVLSGSKMTGKVDGLSTPPSLRRSYG